MDLSTIPITVTLDLVVLGGFSSALTEFLRGLILKIEDYPRLAKNWKFVPSMLGMIGILIYPAAAASVSSPLILLAHGAGSPTLFYVAYPYLEKLLASRIKASIESAGVKALPTKEGDL